jgi:xanthine dehydrogenase accessory factor
MSGDLKENIYLNLLETMGTGEKAVLITKVEENRSSRFIFKESFLNIKEKANSADSLYFDKDLFDTARESLETGSFKYIKGLNQELTLFEPYFPEPNLIVFGGGHVAKPLVEFAAKVGFLVTVIDDRPFFANSARFPLAEKVICESFEKSFNLLNINESSFVVIVTRGHKHDMMCLKETLKYNTAYVGLIGSKRRINIVKEQLLDEGYTHEQIKNLNAPIGLDIGALTPEEIAVSIVAQLISYRRKKKSAQDAGNNAKVNWPEFDRIVIEELAKKDDEPKAIVTVISTKGSVPRKAGAKMIVFADGRVLGSIGGGCSEGEVIVTARDIIKSGGYQTQTVDMTGYIAEEEGMVCGGIMEVIIECL